MLSAKVKATTGRLLGILAVAGCLATAKATVSWAQGTPGLTIFGGVERANELNFRLDYGTRRHPSDRYRLRIPAEKMTFAVAQFSIDYPDYYSGKFDLEFDPEKEPDDQPIEIRIQKDGDYVSLPIDEVIWDQENQIVEIYPLEPVPAGYKVELVFSNVKNPRNGGMYYFNCKVLSPGDLPLLRYLGTWVISIGN